MIRKLSGPELWNKAKTLIPGGNQLLSKRAEIFLPDYWPAYYSKAEATFIWDLDGCKFLDMCLMGVGTNTLGYSNEKVDQAAMHAVKHGNLTTLNCPEEVYLAERLVELHDWADMVRFARSGGEANAISIRIGRAASGREGVAFCGYHGWHDWYLAANLGQDSNLNSHLLGGLEPNGVPSSLTNTVHPFEYNDLTHLEHLIATENIGVIKMEVIRNKPPENDFLHKVRKLASDHNIVLIFDECTSGFRETFGGLHKNFGVEPDVAVFGKALGNGYALTAVIGSRDIMEAAQTTFISSTFWTERVGPSAALVCLDEMEALQSWKILPEFGRIMKKGWQELAQSHDLKINIQGIDAIPSFSLVSDHWLEMKTLISQEMLKKNILASNLFYPSVVHSQGLFDQYFNALDTVFKRIARHDENDIAALLDGPVCHSGFNRLN